VPTIVNDNITFGGLLTERFPELPVCLVTNIYLYLFPLIFSASFLDVNAGDTAFRTEVGTPHGETAAAVDADFDDVSIRSDKLS
jgi:hypothetical protein